MNAKTEFVLETHITHDDAATTSEPIVKRQDLFRPKSNQLYVLFKRGLDIMIAALMMVVFLPVITLCVVWLMVSTRSFSSVFYSHQRVGMNGVEFACLKLRTMKAGAENDLESVLAQYPEMRKEWEQNHKLENDPRIIPGVGHFLRKSSLDELPQLWNILKGDMSMVGPRPVTREELHHYGSQVKYYILVRPGLTGPWQIGGRSKVSFDERVAIDANYVKSVSLASDINIFVQTVRAFLSGRLSGAS